MDSTAPTTKYFSTALNREVQLTRFAISSLQYHQQNHTPKSRTDFTANATQRNRDVATTDDVAALWTELCKLPSSKLSGLIPARY